MLLCETIDTLSFDWYEAPVIPAGGLLLPDYLCPGSEYDLDASALTENGTPDELCFLWEDCIDEDSPLVWEITGDPCVNADCGAAQDRECWNPWFRSPCHSTSNPAPMCASI